MRPHQRRCIEVTGIVQAVGLRPHVRTLATDLGLTGSVRNVDGIVRIEVQGSASQLDDFEARLRSQSPPLARIDGVFVDTLDVVDDDATFRILDSVSGCQAAPRMLPPDTAPCASCLAEMNDPDDRRHRHAFIACTQCGPRFTIARRLPHDRRFTTMAGFEMCPRCRREYEDPSDRRHHAQPIACHDCGPRLAFRRVGPAGARPVEGDAAVDAARVALGAGAVVAIKGIGGYHLAVDAADAEAVAKLRVRKHRPDKPFAVMVADTDNARRIALLDSVEVAALADPSRPVVLATARVDSPLAAAVAPGSPFVGVMLPSSPLHHLLFQPGPSRSPRFLVMTSGNVAGEPICHHDDDATVRLGSIAEAFLTHDRPIHTPCDDSVVRVIDGSVVPLRRSRGFAPTPVPLAFDTPPILATGGDIKCVFGVAEGRHAWLSQHIGDLENLASVRALETSVELLTTLLSSEPRRHVTDRHPDYRSRRWATRRAAERGDADVVEVDHHHAHAAALMADHGLARDHSLVTFVFDGTGLGPDQTLWGGEVLRARYDRYERLGHLMPIPLAGGGGAIANPCRAALSHLRAAGIDWRPDIPAVAACSDLERDAIAAQFAAAPSTSSMGRLFDAVASILGVRHRISYEAQAAIELEHLATSARGTGPRLRFAPDTEGRFDAAPLLSDIVDAHRAGVDPSALAAAFHSAVIDVMVEQARRVAEPGEAVGLTGGVFQNALLTAGARRALTAAGFRVLTHQRVPPNDGGLALGQLAVAAARATDRRHGPGAREVCTPCA